MCIFAGWGRCTALSHESSRCSTALKTILISSFRCQAESYQDNVLRAVAGLPPVGIPLEKLESKIRVIWEDLMSQNVVEVNEVNVASKFYSQPQNGRWCLFIHCVYISSELTETSDIEAFSCSTTSTTHPQGQWECGITLVIAGARHKNVAIVGAIFCREAYIIFKSRN